MKKQIVFQVCCILFWSSMCIAQNVGIGVVDPVRARLELNGGVGRTAAIFGGEGAGVSIQKEFPAIGFNQYFDGSVSRYIGAGSAAVFWYSPITGVLNLDGFPNGIANASASSVRLLTITPQGYVGIGSGISPANPLSFPNTHGNKISLWRTDATHDYGFGINFLALQMYTDRNVEIGVGNYSSFSKGFTLDASTGSMYSKQSGNLNLVPLGVVSYQISELNCSINTSQTWFNNLASNFIISMTSGYNGCSSGGVTVVADLYFNQVTVPQYSKIIVLDGHRQEGITSKPIFEWSAYVNGTTSYKILYKYDGSVIDPEQTIILQTLMFYGIK